MHQQFNIQQLYVRPHCIYVFCIYLRTNSDLCHSQHKLIGFCNRDEKCLQRGTDWVFKYSSLSFVFKGLIYWSTYCPLETKPHRKEELKTNTCEVSRFTLVIIDVIWMMT